jgi:hypothetical protein
VYTSLNAADMTEASPLQRVCAVVRARQLLPEAIKTRGETAVLLRQMVEGRQELTALTEALRKEVSQLRTLRHDLAKWRRPAGPVKLSRLACYAAGLTTADV